MFDLFCNKNVIIISIIILLAIVGAILISLFVDIQYTITTVPYSHNPLSVRIESGDFQDGNIPKELELYISTPDSSGLFPLHYAAIAGNLEMVKSLVAHNVDPNQRVLSSDAHKGYTPLHFAALYAQKNLAKDLVALGANPLLQAENGQTPSELAYERGFVLGNETGRE